MVIELIGVLFDPESYMYTWFQNQRNESIFSYSITPESHIMFIRVMEMIKKTTENGLLSKLSFSAPQGMYREQNRE